jgi:DNA polymerase V
MGFPSPAQDYVETRIDLYVICQVRPSVSLFEIDGVIHLMDSGSKPILEYFLLINQSDIVIRN